MQAKKKVTSHPGKAKKKRAVTLINKYYAIKLEMEDQSMFWFSSHIPLGAEIG